MITEAQLDQVMGSTLYDRDGDKIGKVGQIYLDDDSGQPSWMTVNTGLFGTSESFVPLRQAELDDRGVRVPYQKAQVKDAPHASDDGHLDEAVQDQLYRHYGLDPSGAHEPVGAPSGTGEARGAGQQQAVDQREAADRSTGDRTAERTADVGATGDRATGAQAGGSSSPGPATTGSAAGTSTAGTSTAGSSTAGSSEHGTSTTGTSSTGSPSAGDARVDRSDDGELSGAAPGTAAGAVAGAAAGTAAASARTAPREDGPELGDRTEDQRLVQERADQERADQQRADQQRADQQRADQDRADQDRAEERRGRHASDGPVDGGQAPTDADRATTASTAGGAAPQRPARMRLRRYVVTEQRTITVPVTHEEVRLERVDDDEPGEGTAVSETEVVEIDVSDVDVAEAQRTSTGSADRR